MKGCVQSRGFTLLETLLASALLGALLLALNFFVFSMAEIWGQGSERRLFEQHVRAVTREVEELIRTAALRQRRPIPYCSPARSGSTTADARHPFVSNCRRAVPGCRGPQSHCLTWFARLWSRRRRGSFSTGSPGSRKNSTRLRRGPG